MIVFIVKRFTLPLNCIVYLWERVGHVSFRFRLPLVVVHKTMTASINSTSSRPSTAPMYSAGCGVNAIIYIYIYIYIYILYEYTLL